jgi:hypothetical protein
MSNSDENLPIPPTHDQPDKKVGTVLWRLPKKMGRPRKFETAETLLTECLEYFEWVQNNPIYDAEVVKYKDSYVLAQVTKMRAMTVRGLCIFLNIARSTWQEYVKPAHDFSAIAARVEMMIYTQKIEGTAAGLLNPAIIMRELGMADKKDIDARGQIIVVDPDKDLFDE